MAILDLELELDSLVQADRVHRRLYTDPEIFALEMHRIFEMTWVFVGHDSEIPQPGDYKTTHVGENPVIMTRDRDDQIHVLLNRCRHRGAVVCREERGSTPAFRCSYHGWTYTNRGDLALVPGLGGYGPDFEPAALGLIRTPRVEAYRGFVFTSFNSEVEPLEEHLGYAKHYLDRALDAAPDGAIDVRSGVQRYAYPGNWKFQIENWTDHYHANVVHESAFAIRTRHGGPQRPADPYENDTGWVTSMPRGMNTEKTRAGGMGNYGGGRVPGADEYLQRLAEVRGEAQVKELLGADIQMMIFPGFFIQPGRQHFRILRPVAFNRTEVWAYPYTLRGAPDSFNRFMVQDVAWWASAAGFGQPDDLEQFVRCQTGLQAGQPEWVLFHRGTHNEELLPTGEIWGQGESTHRGIYREWKRLMAPRP